MSRKIIIVKLKAFPRKIFTILIENQEIVELHCSEEEAMDVQLGNIYIGKVKNIVPNIRAAFIEVTKGQECYYALDQHKDALHMGDEILVQVSQEAVKSKVPTVTCNLNLTGKYVVLTKGINRVGISAKITGEQKGHLKELMGPFLSEEYGFIVRTNAKDCSDAILMNETQQLIVEYESLIERAATRTCYTCLKESKKPYIAHLKNVYKEGLTNIVVEDLGLYTEIYDFLKDNQSDVLPLLQHYQDSLLPLHKLYDVETQLKHALQERVFMKSGAYLVIQPTEALTVIDVNTGKCVKKEASKEARLLINLEAAKEAAKQIRLRNLSGIIIIDFINLDQPCMIETLISTLQKYISQDPIPTKFVDITKLQLVELTRKKVRKTLKESLT
ncbi:MAG: ribonuclease E/G [Lachnospiraceae bacterium]